MRKISPEFLYELKDGFLSELTKKVQADIDLDLFIRKGYINIYFKGNSILKLTERKRDGTFAVDIHPKYLQEMEISDLVDEKSTKEYLNKIPQLKENILQFGKQSLEIEYEQLIVRANNNEKRNNSDYFMIDRQYTPGENRLIDLVGIYWPNPRKKEDIVTPCIIEIKFALNDDIKDVDQQLHRYYRLIKKDTSSFAEDLDSSLKQRLTLGLFSQDEKRLEALKTVRISSNFEDYQFVLALVDYNPRSSKLDLSKIEALSFSDQIQILYSGFGIWEDNLGSLDGHE